jgi:hypothetical protein
MAEQGLLGGELSTSMTKFPPGHLETERLSRDDSGLAGPCGSLWRVLSEAKEQLEGG